MAIGFEMRFIMLLLVTILFFSINSFLSASPKLGIKYRYGELTSRHSFYRAEIDTVYYTSDRETICKKTDEEERCYDELNPVFPLALTGTLGSDEGLNNFFFIDFTNYKYDLLRRESFSEMRYLDNNGVERWKKYDDGTNFSLVGRSYLFGYGLYLKILFFESGVGILSSVFDYELSLLDCSTTTRAMSCSPKVILDSRRLRGYTLNPFLTFSVVYYESDLFRISSDFRFTKLSDYYPYYGLPSLVNYTEGTQFPGIEYRYDNDFYEIIAATLFF